MNHIKFLNKEPDGFDIDMPLWRYMKLSTFFSLIHGSVFIPSLKTLSKGDPKEGFLPIESPSADGICAHLEEGCFLQNSEDWLKEKATERDRLALDLRASSPGGYYEILYRIWCAELQARRAVWCWYRSEHESMAMWNIYAHHGIAIRSSVTRMDNALGLADNWEVRVGVVDYKRPDWQSNDYYRNDQRLLLHPFMFKSIDYEHEKEVRLFLKINPKNPPCMDMGIHVPINPMLLIEEVVLSPFILSDEQTILKEMLDKVFESKVHVRGSTGALRHCLDDDFVKSVNSTRPCTLLHKTAANAITSLFPEISRLPIIPFNEEAGLPDPLKQL